MTRLLKLVRSYFHWAGKWLGLTDPLRGFHAFEVCCDCKKPMWLSAHQDCIPF